MNDYKHNPRYAEEEVLVENISVITARNPSSFTFLGTRTYLIGTDKLAIIDPGPDLQEHFNAILSAIGSRTVTHIFITHTHSDHCGLAIKLATKVNAPIFLFGKKNENSVSLFLRLLNNSNEDRSILLEKDKLNIQKLYNGQKIFSKDWALEVIFTPGHHFDHICLSYIFKNILFCGDHVMGWSSTMINYPTGDMSKYIKSLKLLLYRKENLFFPGHGEPIENAIHHTERQLLHKLKREKQIFDCFSHSSHSATTLVPLIYKNLPSSLVDAAKKNILSHLISLKKQNIIKSKKPITPNSVFSKVTLKSI